MLWFTNITCKVYRPEKIAGKNSAKVQIDLSKYATTKQPSIVAISNN